MIFELGTAEAGQDEGTAPFHHPLRFAICGGLMETAK